MKTPDIFDLYADYLITSFSDTTATGLSGLVDNVISHDQVTRFLSQQDLTSKELWKVIKKTVREIETDEGLTLTIKNKSVLIRRSRYFYLHITATVLSWMLYKQSSITIKLKLKAFGFMKKNKGDTEYFLINCSSKVSWHHHKSYLEQQ